MAYRIVLTLAVSALITTARGADQAAAPLPTPADGWSIELVARAPDVLFPTAIVAAPDGALYVGSDPMDMPGPPTEPIDRVLVLRDGRSTVFADKLWSVMGLEWIDSTLYVVHAPFLSALRDIDGDGVADSRVDLVTGLGPKLPGFNGINDHVAGGIRRGIDGFLYIAVGDKGIRHGVGRDGKTIELHGGGVIRVRPDGSGLEVVSTGECSPLSVALSATDDVFTYGNDDDSKKWPNSLTHHIVGGHYGYPYQFLTAPHRALPIIAGQMGGAGAQGICYNDDGLPAEYQGNLIFCDWGLQKVSRFEMKKSAGTFALIRRTDLVSRGAVADFRPFSVAVADDARSLWLVDWAHNGWLADGPKTGRLFRLHYTGPATARPAARPVGDDTLIRLKALDHPALSVRLQSQRILEQKGPAVVPLLTERLKLSEPETGRLHALWVLDAIGGSDARLAIHAMLVDPSARIRLQAARSVGIRADRAGLPGVLRLLNDRDPAVRREAAIAAGRLGDLSAAGPLYAALGEADVTAAWSVRQAIRRLGAWNKTELVEALLDDRRLESALRLTDEAWAVPAVEALAEALTRAQSPAVRGRIVANLAGQYRRYPAWTGEWFGTNPLAGVAPRKTVDWSPEGGKAIEEALALALTDRDSAVRFQAIVGLSTVGPTICHRLRSALVKESDPINQSVLAETLGTFVDPLASPILTAILSDVSRPESVRSSALVALARIPDRPSLRARFSLLYDPKSPAGLVARALPDLARSGFLPPNDLAGFLESTTPAVRAAALLSLNVKKALPDDIKQSILDRLADNQVEVREAAMMALVPLQLRAAIPRLLSVAADARSPDRTAAMTALCGMPDPRAVSLYLAALDDRDPRLRRSAEAALLSIRDSVKDELGKALGSGTLSDSASLTVERILARFEPIGDWHVIGPFPRATPSLFIGEPTIDFARAHVGALGLPVHWSPRKAAPTTGCVDLGDLTKVGTNRGGFGFDPGRSPDLGAFAYAEVNVDSAGPALLLIGSSGTLVVTVNGRPVYEYVNAAGRGYVAGTDLVKTQLAQGRNRILVICRQGIGVWSFGIQMARVAPRAGVSTTLAASLELRRQFALAHDGDRRNGEAIFFDDKGVGCGKCHAAGGRGTASIGPDLTGLATKYDRAELIRSVLEPSHRIATGYQPVIVATRDGKVATGVVRSESETQLEIADAEARITAIPKSDIAIRRVGNVSIMPAKLVETLSPAEFADLVSYLQSLRQPQDPQPPREPRQLP